MARKKIFLTAVCAMDFWSAGCTTPNKTNDLKGLLGPNPSAHAPEDVHPRLDGEFSRELEGVWETYRARKGIEVWGRLIIDRDGHVTVQHWTDTQYLGSYDAVSPSKPVATRRKDGLLAVTSDLEIAKIDATNPSAFAYLKVQQKKNCLFLIRDQEMPPRMRRHCQDLSQGSPKNIPEDAVTWYQSQSL